MDYEELMGYEDDRYDPKTNKESQALKSHATTTDFRDFLEDFKSDTGPIPLSYNLSDLCKVLLENNTSKPLLTKLTSSQLEFINQLVQDEESYKVLSNLEELTLEEPKDEDEDPDTYKLVDWDFKLFESIVDKIFEIIDDILFFGLSKNHVYLDVRTENTGLPHDDRKKAIACFNDEFHDNYERGQRNPKSLTPTGNKAKIILWLYHTPQYATKPLNFWIGAVAHEVLHAFLRIYTCDCWKRCCEENRDRSCLGRTGHGEKFLEVLEAMEEKLSSDLGLGKIVCGIQAGVGREMSVTGWKPSEAQIERWELRKKYPDAVEKVLEEWKKNSSTYSAMVGIERERRRFWLLQNDDENRLEVYLWLKAGEFC